MLKRRKTPLHVLFGEREALRNVPLKNNTMTKISTIPVSGIPLNKIVMIDNHSYEYKGQQTVKRNGAKKTIYLFKGVSTTINKEYTINQAPTFRLELDILKMN